MPSTKCYIFDLESGPAVDANLDHRYQVVLPHPDIHQLAISPNSKKLVCVLQRREEDRNFGSLFIVDVEELIRLASSRSVPISDSWAEDTSLTHLQTRRFG